MIGVSRSHSPPSVKIVSISAKTGLGLETLRHEIRGMAYGPFLESNEPVLITKLRHKVALERAQEATTNAFTSLKQQVSGDCLAVDIRVALDALGEIIGLISAEDVLDRIFQDFCIGK